MKSDWQQSIVSKNSPPETLTAGSIELSVAFLPFV